MLFTIGISFVDLACWEKKHDRDVVHVRSSMATHECRVVTILFDSAVECAFPPSPLSFHLKPRNETRRSKNTANISLPVLTLASTFYRLKHGLSCMESCCLQSPNFHDGTTVKGGVGTPSAMFPAIL